ncbi:hypothetical protein QP494_00450 [Lactobacillus mulieris]|jgi:hypothetical protein|nr:hypothetical protein [Lactobacillus mulieris]MCW8093492.1 hypothetical protein [Lactobacillus mulieris]MDK7324893.1 hypothetical protein [Lactobacillus mulieris]
MDMEKGIKKDLPNEKVSPDSVVSPLKKNGNIDASKLVSGKN